MANMKTKNKVNGLDVSVVIPTFRDERYIDKCLRQSLSFFRNNSRIRKFEIIFTSDNGGDGTIGVIKSYLKKEPELVLIENRERLRKGGSIRNAMLLAKYPVKLFYDADLSTPLDEVNRFLDAIEDHDIIIGSRRMKDSETERGVYKKMLSAGLSAMNFIVLGLRFSDTQCGFKMFGEKGSMLFRKQLMPGEAFDAELLFLARKFRLRVKEVPVRWHDRDSANFPDRKKLAFNIFRQLLRIRLNDMRGLYG